ncbi:MAG: hypothetical protein U5K73_11135 [Halofilum sp. (in: g-proteobacteria)]|nr:hypothetical protein [Halofilum sp. (in: g-proteobacteria)]
MTITGTNDQPTLDTAQPDQTNDDGETITAVDVSGNFSDVDANDTLTFSASGPADGTVDRSEQRRDHRHDRRLGVAGGPSRGATR